MGKMILITYEDEIKELEYPTGNSEWSKLTEYIGNDCSLLEHVQPRRLYTRIGASLAIKDTEGSKVSMLVDEEFTYHCDDDKINKIASWLYETDRHGYLIRGNALIVGERYKGMEVSFCAMSDEQFDIVYPKLKELEMLLASDKE